MNSPLASGELTSINQHLKHLNELGEHIDKAESCGVDCEMFRRQKQYYETQLTQMKKVYFPGKP